MRSTSSLLLFVTLAVCCVFVSPVTAADPSAVVVLTEANFEQLTATGSWMLEFYAPVSYNDTQATR